MSICSNLAALALVVALTSGAAHASVISQSVDTGLLTADIDSVPLALPLFGSNLGTLTGVSFSLTARITSSGTITNTAAQVQSFTITQDVLFWLDDAGRLSSLLNDLTPDPSVSQSYKRASPKSSLPFGPYDVKSATPTVSAPLAPFIVPGGGIDEIAVSTETGTMIRGGGGNAAADIHTLAQATIRVEYTYTPAPVIVAPQPVGAGPGTPGRPVVPATSPTSVSEPASLAILGASLFALGLLRRRSPLGAGEEIGPRRKPVVAELRIRHASALALTAGGGERQRHRLTPAWRSYAGRRS
jgi:hypothetical protein